jgi:hypothetical protein
MPTCRPLNAWVACLLALAFSHVPAAVAQDDRAQAEPTSGSLNFTNDILPLLSKLSCNAGQCHGKAIGQNGFKLSLYGFDPGADHAAIVHESRGRRVSPAAPDDSLLLLKATGGVAHGGGVRLARDSDAYRSLSSWVAQGAPWGREDDATLASIHVEPGELVSQTGTQHDIQVTAKYSDGSQRDVTATARYDSQTPMLLEVDEAGRITTTGRAGQGVVMVRYGDFATTSRVVIPYGQPLDDAAYASFQPRNFIDELALAQWKKLGIAPSGPASDEVFLRRAYLDVIGTLPTPDEAREFLDDESADKREKLIEQLLARDEHADLWAHRWGELLRIRLGDANFKENTLKFHDWIRASLKDNKPYDQFAREILTATGKRVDHPQVDWWRVAINNQVRVEDTCQVFLGMRVSCANCHNHPFENISQNDYWRFAAFFARVGSPSYGEVVEIKLEDKGEVKHPRTGDVMQPQAFGGPAVEYVNGEDPRHKLVDWMVAPENPYFAKAIANRLWGHYFKVGLIDPVDDVRATNPPSNPALLDALARELVEHKYDLRHLTRLMLTSRLYGLSSEPSEQNQVDTRNYARHYPQRLGPHVLLDAISFATGVPEKFDDYPEIKRALHLPNEKGRSDFLDFFGRSSRDTPCECETSLAPNLAQVLYLLHSDELQRKIAHKEGIVTKLADAETATPAVIEELYLRTVSRRPTPDELTAASGFVDAADSPENRKQAIEDLLWTLLNASEFVFNH